MVSEGKYILAGFTLYAGVMISLIYLENLRLYSRDEVEKERIKSGYVLQKKDLNNNGIPELYYEIGGKKYFTEIDGKNVESLLREVKQP